MDTLLERQRRTHEELESIEQAIVRQCAKKPKSHKEKLVQDLHIVKLLEKIEHSSQQLLNIYEDHDGSRKAEIASIGSSDFGEFYDRLKTVKDHHRRHPNEAVDMVDSFDPTETKEQMDENLANTFTGEESYGRYLDLNAAYELYINLPKAPPMNYINFISSFANLGAIPSTTKSRQEYKRYVAYIKEYLESFFRRAQPLTNLKQIQQAVQIEFQQQQATEAASSKEITSEEHSNDDPSLFCAACQKQFAKKTVFDNHLSGKKHQKAVANQTQNQNGQTNGANHVMHPPHEHNTDKTKLLRFDELLIRHYADELAKEIEDTRSCVERKQSLTVQELQMRQDEEAEELPEEESDNDDDEAIYNPLKLPLGWDGKPIPYWLYKLHGLGIEYPCEICGGFIYRGRKAFEKHFQEWRHTHGMRCLGIPNWKQFYEITLIQDAYALWEKLKDQTKPDGSTKNDVEEFEDAEGNVISAQLYRDLVRQGLL